MGHAHAVGLRHQRRVQFRERETFHRRGLDERGREANSHGRSVGRRGRLFRTQDARNEQESEAGGTPDHDGSQTRPPPRDNADFARQPGRGPRAWLPWPARRLRFVRMDANAQPAQDFPRTDKKPSFPIRDDLRAYLRRYRRDRDLPVTYERMMGFQEGIPLNDEAGKPTLWDTVIYDPNEMRSLNEDLKRIYALLRTDGDISVFSHLYVDRIDFCTFGNSTPFRVRIVNAYNDNQDYFYIKKADASRVYGLELEHLLSPSRLNFITHGNTLVEEHVVGLPGDIFISRWLQQKDLRPIRIAKEVVKFNERCFVRLLGDMRSYNFVVLLTPDFDDWQVRRRAMDF